VVNLESEAAPCSQNDPHEIIMVLRATVVASWLVVDINYVW
jgi:hypothetical protein